MRGIIYLGTPHTGTTFATTANKFFKIVKQMDMAMVNLSIIQELQEGSSTLFELQHDMHGNYKCKVVCFYETIPTRMIRAVVSIASLAPEPSII